MPTAWSHRFAHRTHRIKSSVIRDLLKLTQSRDMISFAGGLPAGELFPVERFEEACHKVLGQMGSQALQYGPTDGYEPLRSMIASNLQRYGITASPDNVLITSGSQQALDLIGKLLINEGDGVLVEAPSYLGALQAFDVYGAEYVPVPTDDAGICTDLMEDSLRFGPKFMYLLPNFQNPAGVSMSLERRKEVVALSERYGVPIIEDDPYGQLRFENEHIPPLFVLDREIRGDGAQYDVNNIIYLSTFSKTLAPGIRLGWIVAPRDVITKLIQLKQGADLHTSTFTQMVAYEVARDGFIDEHSRTIRAVYRERRNVMLDALEEFFPAEATWTRPDGGLFLWVTLPEGVSSEQLLRRAIEHNVAFVPGTAFFTDGGGLRNMRLNFSASRPEKIREGIRRLAEAVVAELQEAEAELIPVH